MLPVSKRGLRSLRNIKKFATLSPIEEFPYGATLGKYISKPNTITSSILQNGIKLVSRDVSESSTVNLSISIAAGSVFETTENKGSSYLLKTSAFAGTGLRSGLRLTRDLENLGAKFNSDVDRENIIVSLNVESSFVDDAFAVIAETIVSPPKEYVVKEYKDLASISYVSYLKNPLLRLDQLIYEAAFGENSPYGSSLYAPEINDINSTEVLNYRNEHFKSGNIVIAGNGISHDKLKQLADRFLQSIPEGCINKPSSTYHGGIVKIRENSDGQTHYSIAFPLPKVSNGLSHSVLFECFKRGLEHANLPKDKVIPYLLRNSGNTLFGAHFIGNSSSEFIKSALDSIKSIPSSSEVIEQAKIKVSFEHADSLDSKGSFLLLKSQTLGIDVSKLSDVSDITLESIKGSIISALSSNPSVVVLGNTTGSVSFEKILQLLK